MSSSEEQEIERLIQAEVQKQIQPLAELIMGLKLQLEQLVEAGVLQPLPPTDTLQVMLRGWYGTNEIARVTWDGRNGIMAEGLLDRLRLMPRPELVRWWEAITARQFQLNFVNHEQLVQMVLEEMVAADDPIGALRAHGLV